MWIWICFSKPRLRSEMRIRVQVHKIPVSIYFSTIIYKNGVEIYTGIYFYSHLNLSRIITGYRYCLWWLQNKLRIHIIDFFPDLFRLETEGIKVLSPFLLRNLIFLFSLEILWKHWNVNISANLIPVLQDIFCYSRQKKGRKEYLTWVLNMIQLTNKFKYPNKLNWKI